MSLYSYDLVTKELSVCGGRVKVKVKGKGSREVSQLLGSGRGTPRDALSFPLHLRDIRNVR